MSKTEFHAATHASQVARSHGLVLDGALLYAIPLSLHHSAIIDISDYHLVEPFTWRTSLKDGHIYAITDLPRNGDKRRTVSMHRFLLGETDPSVKIDHWDGDGLHNWRANLRRCSNAQNICNQRPHRDKKTSKLKGVCFYPQSGTYRAQIMANYRKFNLGSFPTAEEAARAYDAKAVELFGEFARLNFPPTHSVRVTREAL